MCTLYVVNKNVAICKCIYIYIYINIYIYTLIVCDMLLIHNSYSYKYYIKFIVQQQEYANIINLKVKLYYFIKFFYFEIFI